MGNAIVSKLIHKGPNYVSVMVINPAKIEKCNCNQLRRLVGSLGVPPCAVTATLLNSWREQNYICNPYHLTENTTFLARRQLWM